MTITNLQHQALLKAVRKRKGSGGYATGITTADRYVRSLVDCVGAGHCKSFLEADGKSLSMDAILKEASGKLAYCGSQQIIESKSTSLDEIKKLAGKGLDGIQLPPHTAIGILHVLTTPREDRDKDVLHTEGATVDQKMPLLWQHIHTLPIGKYVATVEHSPQVLRLFTALLDLNELTADAIKLVEADALRFSHGFFATEYKERKTQEHGMMGWDVLKYNVVEESLVSVPSNVDAEIELYTRGQLASDHFKAHGKYLFDNRQKVFGGVSLTMPGSEAQLTFKTFDDLAKSIVRPEHAAELEPDLDPEPTPEPVADKAACACGSKAAGTPAAPLAPAPVPATPAPAAAKVAEPAGKKGYVDASALEGSYSWRYMKLQDGARKHLQMTGVDVRDRDYVYVAALWDGYGLIARDRYIENGDGPSNYECHFFRSDWTAGADGPIWNGAATQVEIETTTRLVEIQKGIRDILGKAGRVLSARNYDTLQAVCDDLEEAAGMTDVPRGASALIERAVGKIKSVMDSAKPEEETEQTSAADITAKDAALALLVKGDDELLRRTLDAIQTRLDVSRLNENGRKFRKAFGIVR